MIERDVGSLTLTVNQMVNYLSNAYISLINSNTTLEKGSLVVANRLYGDLEVGDIMVFEHEGTVMVKRIAAGPGE